MLAVTMPSSSCRLGWSAKKSTDTTVVTSIAMDVAYTCRSAALSSLACLHVFCSTKRFPYLIPIPCRVLHQYHTCCNSSGLHGKVQGQTFRMESANFITQDTSRPLNARLATTMTVTQS